MAGSWAGNGKGAASIENKFAVLSPKTRRLQDTLTGALIGLARAAEGSEAFLTGETEALTIKALAATAEGCGDATALSEMLTAVRAEKARLAPGCSGCPASSGRTGAHDTVLLLREEADIRSLKFLLLLCIRTLAAYACSRGALDAAESSFFLKALFAIGADRDREELLPTVTEAGLRLCAPHGGDRPRISLCGKRPKAHFIPRPYVKKGSACFPFFLFRFAPVRGGLLYSCLNTPT